MLILTLLGAYIFVKAINYYNVANDVVLLETSAFRKYLKIYDLTENKAPRNINALKEYIKMKNLSLYNKMKAIDINYLKKEGENYGVLYLNGFDNKDDSLNISYNLSDVDFFHP